VLCWRGYSAADPLLLLPPRLLLLLLLLQILELDGGES
jgi:hypothetical protein